MSQVLIESEGTRKQVTGTLANFNWRGKPKNYCALGALACEAGLITTKKQFKLDDHTGSISYHRLVETYGVDPNKMMTCPAEHDGERRNPLYHMIFHLNDNHGWTFEQIGNWLKDVGY